MIRLKNQNNLMVMHMLVTNFLSILFLFILTGCHKISIKNEFTRIENNAREITGEEIKYHESLLIPQFETQVQQQIKDGISRQQALGIALKNNPELQVMFETLGIAKSDLEQAGLYTNPNIHCFFWPPIKGQEMEFETGASFKISDFWQVPLRRKVQKDVLETVTYTILASILDIMAKTNKAYDKILFTKKQLETAQDIVKQSMNLKNAIDYRQEFGFSSDLDKHFANVMVGNSQLEIVHLQTELAQAYINMKNLLGITPTVEPIKLSDNFYGHIEYLAQQLPSLEQLEEWALSNRPEILNAHMKIKQYRDTIAFEKSRVFNDVHAGLSYKRDFEGARGMGPSFGLSIPIFDTNNAQISRVEFQLEQAKQELLAIRLAIQKEVQSYYTEFINRQKEIMFYKDTILPSIKKAFAYTDKYEQRMQITMVTLLQTKTTLYQTKLQYNKAYHDALNAFTHLERAVGKRLSLKNDIF